MLKWLSQDAIWWRLTFIVALALGLWIGGSSHACPEPDVDHVECRIGADFEAGKLFRANVAFSDAVDQYNECNEALMLCRGWLPPIEGDYDDS